MSTNALTDNCRIRYFFLCVIPLNNCLKTPNIKKMKRLDVLELVAKSLSILVKILLNFETGVDGKGMSTNALTDS